MRLMNNLSLRVKLVLPTWILMTTGILIFGAAVDNVAKSKLEEGLETRTQLMANVAANNLMAAVAFDDRTTGQELLEAMSVDSNLIGVRVVFPDGNVFSRYLRLPIDCRVESDEIACVNTRIYRLDKPISLGGETLARLEVVVSREAIEREKYFLATYLVVGIGVLSVLSLLFGMGLHRVVSRPLASLHQAMSTMIRLGVFGRAIPVRHNDELGRLTACFNDLIADLSERDHQLKQTLKQLEDKTHYIGQVLDTMEQGVLVVATGETVTYFNPALVSMLSQIGCEPNDIHHLTQIMVPKVKVTALIQAIGERRVLHDVVLQHPPSGKTFSVSIHPMAYAQHSLVQLEDITEKREAERRRRLAELIFDKSQDSTLVLSRSLAVQTQNAACIARFGVQKHWRGLSAATDASFSVAELKQLLSHGAHQSQKTLLSRHGQPLPCQVNVTTLMNPFGRIDGFVVTLIDQSAEHEIKRLHHIANHDVLTGLANRARAFERLNDEHTNRRNMHVLFLDLDGFKAVNDQFGHKMGDELLKVIAKRLKSSVSRRDFVARLSGDEFLIALFDAEDMKLPIMRILNRLSLPIVIDGCKPQVSASIGVRYWAHDDNACLADVVEQADRAMYDAKANGKNGYAIASEGQCSEEALAAF